ncbi:WD40-repeat-containing domain protein [Nemania sp. FL0031]|nr:WD40-repeat-containing domain protein [Nemania sp. FL0031]
MDTRAKRRRKIPITSTTEPSQWANRQLLAKLLAKLNVVDPRTKILEPNPEKKEAIDALYDSLCVTEQYGLFQNWKLPNSQLLCITGSAGQGKSTLLMAVLQKLSSKSSSLDNPQCLSFFIFDHNRSDSNNAAAALRNIIWLLLQRNHSLSSHLEKKFHLTGRNDFNNQGDFPALSSIFYDMILDDKNFPETHFVIDALDECVSNQDFLDLIVRSIKLSKKVRWLVSSNECNTVTSFPGQIGSLFVKLGPGLQGSAKAIDKYIKSKVSTLAEKKKYDNALAARVITTLFEHAQANYLWINVICVALQAEEARDAHRILDQINNFTDLNLLYGHVAQALDNLPGQDGVLCKKVLSTMAIIYDALHVNELKALLRLAEEINLMAILEKCSPFLQVRDGLVSFSHLSAKEYVRRNVVNPVQAHSALAGGCLDYLEEKLVNTTGGFREPPRNEAPLEDLQWNYASLHWMIHLSEIPDVIDHTNICAKVHALPTKYVLGWADQLKLRGQLKHAIARLRKLDLRLQGQIDMNSPGTLQADIREAHNFLRRYESMGSTSGNSGFIPAWNTLLHCPENSLIRKTWMPKVFSRISVPEAKAQNWPSYVADFPGETSCVWRVAFSPDGRLIVSGSGDPSMRVWDTEMGTVQHTFNIQGGGASCVAFSSNGLIAVGSFLGVVTLWDSTTGRQVKMLATDCGTVNSICFSADGNKLMTASSLAVRIYNLNIGESAEEGQPVSIHQTANVETNITQLFGIKGYGDSVTCTVFSPDGTLLAIGSSYGRMWLWDTKADKSRLTLEGHTKRVNSLVFSPDGRLLVSGSDDGSGGVWSLETETQAGQRLHNLDSGQDLDSKEWHSITSVSFSPDGSSLAMSTPNTIHIWSTKTWERLYVIEAGISDCIRTVVYAPSGGYLASASQNNGVQLWYAVGTSTKREEQSEVQPNQRSPVVEIATSLNGYVAAGHLDGSISLWDTKTRTPIAESMGSEGSGGIESLMSSPHDGGRMLLSSYNDWTVRVYEVSSRKLLYRFPHKSRIWYLTWSPDGTSIASASDDRSIRIWKIGGEKSNAPYTIENAHDYVSANCVAFSPNGKHIVSGGKDWKVVVWKLEPDNTWERKHVLEAFYNDVMSVCVSLDSNLIVASSADRTLQIWDIETGEPIRRIGTETAGGYRRMWFDPRSSDYVMTEMGLQPLSPPSSSSQIPKWCPYRLIFEDKMLWAALGDRREILLSTGSNVPQSWGVQDHIVVIGDISGYVRIYDFTEQVTNWAPTLTLRKRRRE